MTYNVFGGTLNPAQLNFSPPATMIINLNLDLKNEVVDVCGHQRLDRCEASSELLLFTFYVTLRCLPKVMCE